MKRIGVGGFTTTPRMRELVNQVLDSGRVSYGPFSRQFEHDFAALHGCQFGVLSNSGTSSLQIALQTLKELHRWQDGQEVIVPAVTFVATVNVVLHNRLTPVLVDVEPDYYSIDPAKLESAITPNTCAIILVHLFGQPCDMSAVMGMRRKKLNVGVIEDSCETMFATHHRRPVGSWGDIGVFSSYVAHILTTGVGGVAITDNPDYVTHMRSLVNHGRDPSYLSIDDDDTGDLRVLREVVSRRFNFMSIGHSFRITELEAALAVAQLETWRENIAQRQTNAAYLTKGLRQFEDRLQLPAVRPHTTHSYMMWPVVLREGNKWSLIHHLEERGIETRELLRLTDQPCYRGLWDPDDYPVAKWLNEQGYYVGCHPGLTTNDLDHIIGAHEEYFNVH